VEKARSVRARTAAVSGAVIASRKCVQKVVRDVSAELAADGSGLVPDGVTIAELSAVTVDECAPALQALVATSTVKSRVAMPTAFQRRAGLTEPAFRP